VLNAPNPVVSSYWHPKSGGQLAIWHWLSSLHCGGCSWWSIQTPCWGSVIHCEKWQQMWVRDSPELL
jgi:hypothetical protein